MAIVTLEDLQGTIEVVVFPRLYETSRPTWRDGAILLVAGRIDHRGEEVSMLADLVVDWDDALARGPEAFAREVAAGDRGGRGGRGGRLATATAPRMATATAAAPDGAGRPGHAAAPGVPAMAGAGAMEVRPAVPFVSPLRRGATIARADLPRRSPRRSRSRPTSNGRQRGGHRAGTATRSPRSRTRRANGSWPTRHRGRPARPPGRARCCTSDSPGAAGSERVVGAWSRSRSCSATGPARRAS